jgi:O-antigen/teichoic acid export membrane protein
MTLSAPTARTGRVDAAAGVVGTLIIQGCGFVAGLLVARGLGAQARGTVALVALTYGQAASVASLGLDTALVHFGTRARDGQRALARRSLPIALAQGLVAALVGWLLLRTLLSGSSVSALGGALTIAALAAPASLVLAYGNAVLRASGRLVEASVIEVAAATSTVAVIIGGVVTDRIWLAVLGAAAGTALGAGLSLVLIQRLPGRAEPEGAPSLGRLVRYGLAGHVGTVFQNLNYRADLYLVALMLSTGDVGVYAVAVSVAEGLLLIPNSLGAVVMHRAALDPKRARATEVALRIGLASATAGGLLLAVASHRIVPAVFGHEFSGASDAVVALLPGIVALVVWKTLINDLAGRGFPAVKSTSSAVALGVTLVANLLLIPPLGILGAAVASSLAYAAAAVVTVRRYRSVTGRSLLAVVMAR